MIIIDTNVVSEPSKQAPNPAVLAWLNRQDVDSLFFTAINLSELLVGVEIMPDGKRKRERFSDMTSIVATLFGSRILPFDEAAAVAHASVVARTRAAGSPIPLADGQIAAIAHVHGFAVATRDAEPFLAAGVTVINPWDTSLQ